MSDPDFAYVEALVNMIKHQNVIAHSVRAESSAHSGYLDIVLHPFDYKGTKFLLKRGDDLVGPIKDGFVRCIAAIRVALNHDLRSRTT